MNSILGSLGPVGLAVVLTFALLLCTTKGAHAKPMGTGLTVIVSLIAGASYAGAGPPFDTINHGIDDGVEMVLSIVPGMTMPALSLCLVIAMFWFRVTTRTLGMMGVVLYYLASNSGGAWGTLSAKILLISQGLAQ
jgi:hypothetical protein